MVSFIKTPKLASLHQNRTALTFHFCRQSAFAYSGVKQGLPAAAAYFSLHTNRARSSRRGRIPRREVEISTAVEVEDA